MTVQTARTTRPLPDGDLVVLFRENGRAGIKGRACNDFLLKTFTTLLCFDRPDMNKLTPPLPLPTQIDSYTLGSLVSEDSLFFLYEARGENGQRVLLREFCPRFYAARDPETGKLRYADDPEVREKIHGLKREFDALYGEAAYEQVAALGTVYMVQSVAVPNPPPVHSEEQASGKKPNPFVLIIACAVVLAAGVWAYKSFFDGGKDAAPVPPANEKNVASENKAPVQPEKPETTASEEQPAEKTDDAAAEPADIVIDDAEESVEEIVDEDVPAADTEADEPDEASGSDDAVEASSDELLEEGDEPIIEEDPEDADPAPADEDDGDTEDFEFEKPEDPFASVGEDVFF